MLNKLSAIGLLSFAVIGGVALPAAADTAVVQQGTQDLYIQGDGNTAVQRSEQINRVQRSRVETRTNSTGVVQDIYQGATVVGDDNAAFQESSQINIIERGNRPQGRGQGRGNITIQQKR